MGDSGLSQDDFRKLLQTPRAAPGEAETPRFKAPAPKAPRNAGAVFATPQSIRKKQQRPKQQQAETAATPSNYRDRAAERRSNESQEQTTEELLQGTTREEDETLDPKQVYEQSKYLGGDVDHTHLVKGLDYSLLEKVRSDLTAKLADAKGEAALDNALDKLGTSDDEEMSQDEEEEEQVSAQSMLAKNLIQLLNNKPQSNELFAPGRMAFVFELADEVGHYADAYALPTTVIRSKADVLRRRTDRQAETELVISKISRIMRPVVVKEPEPVIEKKLEPEHVPAATIDSDDDIFSDAEDYSLDEETLAKNKAQEQVPARNYFGDEDKQEEEEEDTQMKDEVSKLLSQATKSEPEQQSTKRRKYEQEEDADAMDIDMFGLSTSALPTSFEERQRTVAYDPDDEQAENEGTTSLVDQGTHRNKKAQLTRWDFDDEEEWQKYKDSVEIHPKSAFQFGVKLGDGRKRNREQRRGMSEKQKLNRDYQMVKNVMDKKYGKQ